MSTNAGIPASISSLAIDGWASVAAWTWMVSVVRELVLAQEVDSAVRLSDLAVVLTVASTVTSAAD